MLSSLESPWPITLALVLFAVNRLLYEFMPPAILHLGTSGPESVDLRHWLARAVSPYRVVVLFDDSVSGSGFRAEIQRPVLKRDNYRTLYGDWRALVHSFMDMVPFIVVDCRIASPAVVDEVRWLLGRTDLLRKALFIVGPSGQAPAWEAAANGRIEEDVRKVERRDLISALLRLGGLKLSPFSEIIFKLEWYSMNSDSTDDAEKALESDFASIQPPSCPRETGNAG